MAILIIESDTINPKRTTLRIICTVLNNVAGRRRAMEVKVNSEFEFDVAKQLWSKLNAKFRQVLSLNWT